MKSKRINNDIRIRWNINQNGGDIDLEAMNAKVTLTSPDSRNCNITADVKSDYILVTYKAADQHALGTYTLTLTIDLGEGSAITVDEIKAFALVPHTACENDDTEVSPVEFDEIELETEVFLDTAVIIQQCEEIKARLDTLEQTHGTDIATLQQRVNDHDTTLQGIFNTIQSLQQRVKSLETTTRVDTRTTSTQLALSNTMRVIERVGVSNISKPILIPANVTFSLNFLSDKSTMYIFTPANIKAGADLTSKYLNEITSKSNPQAIQYYRDVMLVERGEPSGNIEIVIQDDASVIWSLIDAQVSLALLSIEDRLSSLGA